jgi:hypothetical protein
LRQLTPIATPEAGVRIAKEEVVTARILSSRSVPVHASNRRLSDAARRRGVVGDGQRRQRETLGAATSPGGSASVTPDENARAVKAHRDAEARRDYDAILDTFTADCSLATAALAQRGTRGRERRGPKPVAPWKNVRRRGERRRARRPGSESDGM